MTPGDTVISDLINKHCDIEQLTYTKLGKVKDLIIDSIKTEKIGFITKRQLKTILIEAIGEGKLDKEKLNPELIQNEKL